MIRFLSENARWLATGILLAFGSSFGQTWFISLFAGEIRAEYGLSDGDWGLIYTLATLASAALLLSRGSWADTVPLSRLAPLVAILFAVAAAAMALGGSVLALGLTVFGLRFCGQGMFTHIKSIAMARWFVATRGRALALSNLGHPLGEVVMPLPVILLIGAIGWRASWGVVAVVIGLVFVPLLMLLLAQDRTPRRSSTEAAGTTGLGHRHWTRADVLHHWLFWALVPMLLTPGFIGTVIFFHQVHVAEVKGWSLTAMAPGYAAFATATISSALVAGWACDRFGPARLLPFVVMPLALGIFLLGPVTSPLGWILVLGIMGISQGMAATLWGTLLPFAYGTDHLGSVWAVATALMVLSTAIGPGITGLLIDRGIDFPEQGAAMALWCVAISAGAWLIMRKLTR